MLGLHRAEHEAAGSVSEALEKLVTGKAAKFFVCFVGDGEGERLV